MVEKFKISRYLTKPLGLSLDWHHRINFSLFIYKNYLTMINSYRHIDISLFYINTYHTITYMEHVLNKSNGERTTI